MAEKGTPGEWFLAREAAHSDMEESVDDIEPSADSEISDLFDDSEVNQGNSLHLYHQQEGEQHERQLSVLKRKLVTSPEQNIDLELSPRLDAIAISPAKPAVKRRLFTQNDSGLDLPTQYEATNADEEGQEQVAACNGAAETLKSPPQNGRREEGTSRLLLDILKTSNRRAVLLARFKQMIGISYTELTRTYKNDKTCTGHWVAAVYDVHEVLYEGCKALLQPLCTYYNISRRVSEQGSICLMLLSFQANKCRETVQKLLCKILQANSNLMLLEPPRLRSQVAALYWFKKSFSSCNTVFGDPPEWLKKQTIISHQTAEELTFNLQEMVQFAYDKNILEEDLLAYEYAQYADENSNARAWLHSNCQSKYVKEAVTMVRYYKSAEMKQMSISEWIFHRAKQYNEEGDWKPICKFLTFQNVEVPAFINALKYCLKGRPKKTCMVFWGPPNTGKSMFTHSLMKFMDGKVLSFVNHMSHFWLQPLRHAKIALVDDATKACWDYFDTHLRNALDGNDISIDAKHKNLIQLKCPPLLVTTNLDLYSTDRWKYLHSRVVLFNFPNVIETDGEDPLFTLCDIHWKSFFQRLWKQLDLSDQEDEGDE